MRVDSAGPSIEDLRTFLLLNESEGVADVADKLGIDVSVVSRRLRTFRELYGLLQKQGGSLVLTDRGRELLPTVRAIVQGYDALIGKLRRRPEKSNSLTVAVGNFGAAYLMPEVVARFSVAEPTTTLKVRSCRGRERILGVIDGRYDLAILSHSIEQIRPLLGDSPVAIETLAPRPFVVISRRGTPDGNALSDLPRDATITIRDLSRLNLIGLDEAAGVRTQLERQAADAGVRLKFSTTGGGWIAARESARHGLGTAIVPVEALTDADASEFTIRALARPLCPVDHLLHRPAEAPRIDRLRQTLTTIATEQSQRQQGRLGKLITR
jgi:DNA-binding transcriptional LysR family regulator